MTKNGKNLLVASSKGDAVQVRRLLALGTNPDTKNRLGETSLMLACANGDVALAKALVDSGASLTMRDKERKGPLMHSIQGTPRVSLIRYLIEQGALTDEKDLWGCTPLMRASAQGSIRVVNELLRHFADVNAVSKNDETPLTFAIVWERFNVVDSLIIAGANINWVDQNGWTPLIYAKASANKKIIRLLSKNGAQEKRRR